MIFGNIFPAVCAVCFGCLVPCTFLHTVSEAFFPGPAAELFARLPAAIETLQGRLGSDEFLALNFGKVIHVHPILHSKDVRSDRKMLKSSNFF